MNTFESELESLLPLLRRYALVLTRSGDQADDLTQDLAERALRKQALFVPDAPDAPENKGLKPWLMTMMRNLHLNRIRAENARPRTVAALEEDRQAAPDRLEGRLQLSDTARAIDVLPEDQREVLLTVVVGGLSYREAAETLAIPTGTLMSRLGRARARLRELMQQEAI